MAGLPPKEEKEDSSDNEHIWLDPYYLFNRHFREKDGKGTG